MGKACNLCPFGRYNNTLSVSLFKVLGFDEHIYMTYKSAPNISAVPQFVAGWCPLIYNFSALAVQ